MLVAPLDVCLLYKRQSAVFPVYPPGSFADPSLALGAGGAQVNVNAGGQVNNPWEHPPAGSTPFDYIGVIDTPAAGSNDVVVLSFQVPNGWDGTIKRITNRYTGPGFDEGSGDLTWRIRRDGQYVKNYDDIRVTLGDVQNGREVSGGGILISTTQLVEYTITVAPAFAPGAGTKIICAFTGFFWPRQ